MNTITDISNEHIEKHIKSFLKSNKYSKKHIPISITNLLDYIKNDKNGFSKHNANIIKPVIKNSTNLLEFATNLSDMLHQITKDSGFKQLTITNTKYQKPNQLDYLDEYRQIEYQEHQNNSSLFNFSEFHFKFTIEETNNYNIDYKKYQKVLDEFNSGDRNLPLNKYFAKYNFVINSYTPKHDKLSFYSSKNTLLQSLHSLRTELKQNKRLQDKLDDLEIIKSNIKPETNQIHHSFNLHEHFILTLYSKLGIKMKNIDYQDDITNYEKRTKTDQLNNFIRELLYLFNTIMNLIYPFYRVNKSKNGYYLIPKTDKEKSNIFHQLTELSILNLTSNNKTAQTKFSGLVPLNNMTKNDYTALNQEQTKPALVIGFIKNGKFLNNDRGQFIRNILLKKNWNNIKSKIHLKLKFDEKRKNHSDKYLQFVNEEINKELVNQLSRKQVIDLKDTRLYIHFKKTMHGQTVISAGIRHKKKGKLDYIPINDKYSKIIKEHRKLIFEFKQNSLEFTMREIKKSNSKNSKFEIDRQTLSDKFNFRMIKKLRSPKLKHLSHLEKSILKTECYLEFNTTLLHLHHKSIAPTTIENEINKKNGVNNKLFFMITNRKIINLRYHRKDELTKSEINSHSLKTTLLDSISTKEFEFIISNFRKILNDYESTLFHLSNDFSKFTTKSIENKSKAIELIGKTLLKKYINGLEIYKKQLKYRHKFANDIRKKVKNLSNAIDIEHNNNLRKIDIRNREIAKQKLKNKPVKLLPLPIEPLPKHYLSNKRELEYKEFNRTYVENTFFKSFRNFNFNKSELYKKEKLELQYKQDLTHYKKNINLYDGFLKSF